MREEEKRGGSGQDVDDADMIPFEDNEDDEEEDDSDDDNDGSSQTVGPGPVARGTNSMIRGQMWGAFGMGRGGRGIGLRPGGRGMGFYQDMSEVSWNGIFDRFGMGPSEGFGIGLADMFHPGGPGRGFPHFGYPGPGFAGPDFSNMGPVAGMNFGPMDAPGLVPGMIFHGRPPAPNCLFPPNSPAMIGPPGGHPLSMVMGGGARPHFIGGPGGPIGCPPWPLGGNLRPLLGGDSGRGNRGTGDQQKRRRSDRSGSDRTASGEECVPSAKPRSGTLSTEEVGPVDTEPEFSGVEQRNQGQDGPGYGSGACIGDNEEDDSVSEDEAPRRSRHGEGKKRRRDWDTEGNGGRGEHWEQDLEQGGQWEPAVAKT